ncbi:MAG: hypothetical protein ACKO96_34865, partial [Flammeovirgaceae bacterium]
VAIRAAAMSRILIDAADAMVSIDAVSEDTDVALPYRMKISAVDAMIGKFGSGLTIIALFALFRRTNFSSDL